MTKAQKRILTGIAVHTVAAVVAGLVCQSFLVFCMSPAMTFTAEMLLWGIREEWREAGRKS